MKKGILGIVVTAGLLLFASCGPKEGVGPITFDNNGNTPTPIVVPTCTPTATPSPVPGLHPTAAPTAAPTGKPTVTPTTVPTETPIPTPTQPAEPTAGPTAEPTIEPTETPSPKPTSTPTPSPTSTPTPSPEPTPEPTSTPTPSPTPSPSPTPTINPEPLVNHGWQKTVSIDEKYIIVFPELYRESSVEKTDRELAVTYFCKDNSDVEFEIRYCMQQTREELIYEILSVGGSVLEERPEERRTTCLWQAGNTMHCAIFIDTQYPQSLLGTAFGEEEWINGVMWVVFSYPAEQAELYEMEQYHFYVIDNVEE